jgi:hypothetical protein
LQVAAEKSGEAIVDLQKTQRDLKKLKDVLHMISEGGSRARQAKEEEVEIEKRRQRVKFTKRISPILNLLKSEIIANYFGSNNHEEIWQELNT